MNSLILIAALIGLEPSDYHHATAESVAAAVLASIQPVAQLQPTFVPEKPKEPENEVPAPTIDDPRAVVVYSRFDRPSKSRSDCVDALKRWNFSVIERPHTNLDPEEHDLALPLVKYRDRNNAWHNWDFCEPCGRGIESFVHNWLAVNSSESKPAVASQSPVQNKALPQRQVQDDRHITGYLGAGGKRWHIVGNDSRESLLHHIRTEHGIGYDLSRLSTEDLREVHSDAHNGRTGTWVYSSPSSAPSPSRATVAAVTRPVARGRWLSNGTWCPTCPR